MSENELTPGVHKAKIEDYGLTTTKEGLPSPFVTFKTEMGRNITWYGSFIEGRARYHTVRALLILGLKGEDLALFFEGLQSGLLDPKVRVNLDIQNDTYNGKTRLKVVWINKQSAVKNKLDKAGAVQKMAGLNLAGDILKQRQEMGLKNDSTKSGQNTKEYTADDIPF